MELAKSKYKNIKNTFNNMKSKNEFVEYRSSTDS